jgi:RHS repeat-associated protein
LDSASNVTAQFVGNFMIKEGNTYQLITDHLGSVRMVVNVNTGEVVERTDYDEFGNILERSEIPTWSGQPFAYAGGLYDSQTKLVRFGARDYEARVGRWTVKDPIRFVGGETSLYGYVGNDPINLVDPSGLRLCRKNLPGLGNTHLDDAFSPLVNNWISANTASGINVSFTSAFRTTAGQQNLQNNPNAITPAAAGSSLHEAGFAVDIAWSQLTQQQQTTVVQNAQNAGISWGGNFTTPDNVHFYSDPGNRTAQIQQAQQASQQGVNCDCP